MTIAAHQMGHLGHLHPAQVRGHYGRIPQFVVVAERGALCADVAGREAAAEAEGAACATIGGREATATVTDPSACADT